MRILAFGARHRHAWLEDVSIVDLIRLTDAELAMLELARPRDFANPLSLANEYPNAIFAERQRRRHFSIRAAFRTRTAE
jgi:hypothetical protein